MRCSLLCVLLCAFILGGAVYYSYAMILTMVMVKFAIKYVIESRVANTVFFVVEGRGLVGEMCAHVGVKNQIVCIYVMVSMVK